MPQVNSLEDKVLFVDLNPEENDKLNLETKIIIKKASAESNDFFEMLRLTVQDLFSKSSHV